MVPTLALRAQAQDLAPVAGENAKIRGRHSEELDGFSKASLAGSRGSISHDLSPIRGGLGALAVHLPAITEGIPGL